MVDLDLLNKYMSKYCPHCQEEITQLDYACDFHKTVYGRQYGTYDFDRGSHNATEDQDNDEDDYDTSDYQYYCPECEEEVDEDDLLDSLDDEDEDEDEDYIPPKRQSVLIKSIISQIK